MIFFSPSLSNFFRNFSSALSITYEACNASFYPKNSLQWYVYSLRPIASLIGLFKWLFSNISTVRWETERKSLKFFSQFPDQIACFSCVRFAHVAMFHRRRQRRKDVEDDDFLCIYVVVAKREMAETWSTVEMDYKYVYLKTDSHIGNVLSRFRVSKSTKPIGILNISSETKTPHVCFPSLCSIFTRVLLIWHSSLGSNSAPGIFFANEACEDERRLFISLSFFLSLTSLTRLSLNATAAKLVMSRLLCSWSNTPTRFKVYSTCRNVCGKCKMSQKQEQ